jgi:hypothetical protein
MFVVAMFLLGVVIGAGSLQLYRAGGGVPRFYQETFGPAVMMACGYGFTAPGATAPESVQAFLRLERQVLNCADFPANAVGQKVTLNGSWYYLYGTTATIWKVFGISWRMLDWLAAVFVGASIATLYGLFRLIAGRAASVMVALLLTLLPVNLIQVPELRDFSKVPFVLLSVYLLARLVIRPTTTRMTIALSALFGGVVGFGYGFRADLMIMGPFGFAIIFSLLPGEWLREWKRNLAALVAAVGAFLLIAAAPLRGLETNGCPFHIPLLGLTDPITERLNVRNGIYSLGGHFQDTFVDLKVGDRASRVAGLGVPNLCDPSYDRASRELFFDYAGTFPADLIARAYAAVLVVLRSGMQVPDLYGPLAKIPELVHLVESIKQRPDVMGLIGPMVTFAAVCVAWASSARLGIALTAFVLFLTGYPAIEFESRHWFHLRFIPWWSLLLLTTVIIRHRTALRNPRHWRRGVIPAAVTVVLMVLTLAVVRIYQHRSVARLAEGYSAASLEQLGTRPRVGGGIDVDWRPEDAGRDPNHRASDMLVMTIDSRGCAAPGPIDLRIGYDADASSHDMSSTVRVRRGAEGSEPTRVYFPVFMQGFLEHTYLRFSHLEVLGSDSDCVSAVARFADRKAFPLWVQMQLLPDWREGPLHQRIASPWPLHRF